MEKYTGHLPTGEGGDFYKATYYDKKSQKNVPAAVSDSAQEKATKGIERGKIYRLKGGNHGSTGKQTVPAQ